MSLVRRMLEDVVSSSSFCVVQWVFCSLLNCQISCQLIVVLVTLVCNLVFFQVVVVMYLLVKPFILDLRLWYHEK
jgi:hypothetical protein